MKNTYTLLSVFLFVSLLILSGCKKDDPEPTPTPIPQPIPCSLTVVDITANINTPTTWYGDTIYIIKAWDFYVNNTLTIQPGAIIKFHPTSGPYLMLGGAGTIIAQGTALKPIIFTSYKDDAHGCDNNQDGSATQPASKDWGEINTNGLNGSVFDYCEFYYGGSVNYNATLTIWGSTATVTNCTFAHNDGSYTSTAGDVGVLDASDAIAGTVIQNNVFYDNIRPLSISTLFSLDNSNVFHNPLDTTATNTNNGIFVDGINEISAPISWGETEVAFVIDDNDLWINAGATLTLANNVVLKLKPLSFMVINDGVSAMVNYNGAGVFFTSYKDDTKKGDTNGDGAATTPADYDWGGIYDNSLTIPSPYYFLWPNILYDDAIH